jgi:hypothetical protein
LVLGPSEQEIVLRKFRRTREATHANIQALKPGNWRELLWLLVAEASALLLFGAALGIVLAFL